MKEIEIPLEIVGQIMSHVQSVDGEEVCGFLSSRNGDEFGFYPIRNKAADPSRLFHMDEKEQITAMKNMREKDEKLFAIYHSHPTSAAVPSITDIREATYPEALYLIVSLSTVGVLEMRAYYLIGEMGEEIAVKATEN